ncbi:hypothetical protein DITRI_Ditri03aG0127500 [Diplodiscus trichospermus]
MDSFPISIPLYDEFGDKMSSGRVGKKSKKIASKPNSLSLREKIKMVEEEEQVLVKDIDHLQKWTDRIDAMNDERLKEYLKNRPEELNSVKIQTNKPKQKVQRIVKTKTSTSRGIMASVWKFHKEDDEDKEFSTRSDA